jgi:hypothetical protein
MSATFDGLHDVEIEFDGGFPSLSFVCRADAAQDPKCHMVCPRDECEEGCATPDEHEFENAGECMIALWLDNSDAEECVLGGETRVVVPIEYDWHGEGVDWAFAKRGGAA